MQSFVINSTKMFIILIYFYCFVLNTLTTYAQAVTNQIANQKQLNVPQEETNFDTEAPNHRYDHQLSDFLDLSAESQPITISSLSEVMGKNNVHYDDNELLEENKKKEEIKEAASNFYSKDNKHISSSLNDSHNKSIYSSLVKILYHMKQQLENNNNNNNNNQIKSREDNDNKLLRTTTKAPKSNIQISNNHESTTIGPPEATIKSTLDGNSLQTSKLKSIAITSIVPQTTTINNDAKTMKEPITVLEVSSQPFGESNEKGISPTSSGILGENFSEYSQPFENQMVTVTERNDNFDGTIKRDLFSASDHIDDNNILTLKDRYDRKLINNNNNHNHNSNKEKRFSPKLNVGKVDQFSSSSLSGDERIWSKYLANQAPTKVKLFDSDRYNNLDKPLFSITSSSSMDNNDSPPPGSNSNFQEDDESQSFNSIYDTLADSNAAIDSSITIKTNHYQQQAVEPHSKHYVQDDFRHTMPTTQILKPKSKSSTNKHSSINHKSKQYQFATPSSKSNHSQLNRKNGIRLIKPGEYYNSLYNEQKQNSMLYDQSSGQQQQQQQQDDFASNNGGKFSLAQPSGYSESYANPAATQSRPMNGVHYQQVYGQPITNQQQYIQQQTQQYQQQLQQQQQQQQQQNLFAGGNGIQSAGRQLSQPMVNSQSTTSYGSSAQPNLIASSTTSQNEQQRDLLNQPQTIQITAVPNNFPLINGLRVNGLGINNNLVGNGLLGNGLFGLNGMNGFMDPFGRQVVMVNAERRQIDWSFWIWPLLIVIALPLVLGALFVPVFLKTIIILIQVLQSLGLLLPITNAINQQIAQASGVTTTATTTQVEQTKT